MDTRLHPRSLVRLEVTLIELTRDGGARTGTLVDASAGGLRIVLTHALAPGDLVQLDIVDSRFWGHVIHAQAVDGGFSIGIEIERVLAGGSDMSRLLQGLLEESSAEQVETLVSGTRQD